MLDELNWFMWSGPFPIPFSFLRFLWLGEEEDITEALLTQAWALH